MAVKTDKQTKLLRCPNCGEPVSKPSTGEIQVDGCVLHALIGVVRDRGNVSERKLRKMHSQVDVDHLWDRVGRIVDDLEAGYYNRS